ncbi:alpha/beta hydrolase [uncultured Clostridium sp.]|jgi:pimeloyl-ACP methyl ester carboxylesterase|uniref:alpha/beta fold hydrolase n=1 Tax=uncultured Clostridium sp. TaxID=59620 RepID=UPI00261525D5|nr:alpha/beta hydrolase [uncultured Clostridium sp.]
MKKIELSNGRVLSYKREGNLLGETIVFVHSFLWDKNMWDSQIEVLKEEYDCISIDLYGHGESGLLNSEMSLRDLAQDILDFVDDLGILYFHYVGLSIGGMLAPYINDMCSQIETFTICDSYSGIEPSEQKKEYINIIDTIEKQGTISNELVKLIAPMFFSSKNPDITLISKLENHLASIPKENIPTICNIGRAIFNRESSLDLLKNFKVKTSFIVGELDSSRPKEESEQMLKLTPNSHLYVLEHAGHISNIENKTEVNKIFARLFDVDESSEKKLHFFF